MMWLLLMAYAADATLAKNPANTMADKGAVALPAGLSSSMLTDKQVETNVNLTRSPLLDLQIKNILKEANSRNDFLGATDSKSINATAGITDLKAGSPLDVLTGLIAGYPNLKELTLTNKLTLKDIKNLEKLLDAEQLRNITSIKIKNPIGVDIFNALIQSEKLKLLVTHLHLRETETNLNALTDLIAGYPNLEELTLSNPFSLVAINKLNKLLDEGQLSKIRSIKTENTTGVEVFNVLIQSQKLNPLIT